MTKVLNIRTSRLAQELGQHAARALLAAAVASCPVALIWPLAASAQSPAGKGLLKGLSDSILTKDELRACFKRRDELDSLQNELGRERGKLELERVDLVNEGNALKEFFDALDRTSQESVDSYNARAKVRDAGVDSWNARNRVAKEREASHRDLESGWQKSCNERRYREDDEAALRKEKGKGKVTVK